VFWDAISIYTCKLQNFRMTILFLIENPNRDSSVGIVTGEGLDGQGSITDRANFFLYSVETGSGAHPASYLIGIGGGRFPLG
jgi:hypothetical protein